MAKGDGYVKYAKQRDAGPGQDGWAKLKDWKDPVPGRTASNAGMTPMQNGKVGKNPSLKASKGYGSSSVDGASDYTYDGLNKPSDSTA